MVEKPTATPPPNLYGGGRQQQRLRARGASPLDPGIFNGLHCSQIDQAAPEWPHCCRVAQRLDQILVLLYGAQRVPGRSAGLHERLAGRR